MVFLEEAEFVAVQELLRFRPSTKRGGLDGRQVTKQKAVGKS
jgi:hypothetical protein